MPPNLFSIDKLVINNPKRYAELSAASESRLFPYYAGYSNSFAEQILATLPLKPKSLVFDPWNGSGTTTLVANKLGHNVLGLDLNPVMVIVAKAGMLSPLEAPGLESIATFLMKQSKSKAVSRIEFCKDDPLLIWLSPRSVEVVRTIEFTINHVFISNTKYIKLNANDALEKVSPLAAFLYVALFRTVRRLLCDFIPSNPTWTKKPSCLHQRKRPTEEKIFQIFISEIHSLIETMNYAPNPKKIPKAGNVALRIGNAEKVPLLNKTVDAIVSSPPYCTRIDYAVATAIELAILRFNLNEFDVLRRSLTGTSTVEKNYHSINQSWGDTCLRFLDQVHSHSSKASRTYYFKNHLQYFNSLSNSIQEIQRVLKPSGYCVLVVQDSHYKEIHNDVPSIAAEMAVHSGMKLVRRDNFSTVRSMVGINGHAKKYLPHRNTSESVLCFQAN